MIDLASICYHAGSRSADRLGGRANKNAALSAAKQTLKLGGRGGRKGRPRQSAEAGDLLLIVGDTAKADWFSIAPFSLKKPAALEKKTSSGEKKQLLRKKAGPNGGSVLDVHTRLPRRRAGSEDYTYFMCK